MSVVLTPTHDALADTTVIFVGGSAGEAPTPTLDRLAKRLENADAERTWVVFTGDYSETGEFPPADDDRRIDAEADVNIHLKAVEEFVKRGGSVRFLVGHREYQNGRGAVRRLGEFINTQLEEHVGRELEDVPLENPDCGDPVVLELGDNTVLTLLNSPWWMLDWLEHPKTNQGCEIKSRAEFREAFNSVVKKYRTKRLLIAVHHPTESLGRYGGNFDPVDHLKPPIFGSLAIWARSTGLVPEYRAHAMYDSLAESLHNSAETFGSFIFASGHDRNLQLLQVEDQLQIVSGHSGSDPGRASDPEEDEFSAARSGWAEVRVNSEGEGTAVLIDGETGAPLFKRALPPLPKLTPSDLAEPPPLPAGPVKSRYTKRDLGTTGLLRGWIVGDFYRDSYALQLDFDVLDIASIDGGLTPVSIGGGSQTNSIRLVSPAGVQWAARATTKDSTRYLPYPFNRVPAFRYFLEEGFTGVHPSAATMVPELAGALGLLHTRPRLLYLPDQTALDVYRGFITDEVILLERRPEEPDEGALPAHLGGDQSEYGRVKYDSTTKTLSRVRKKPWKRRVAQEEWLRARLLDILLGDWDRHQDQWRFARVKQADGSELYRPIPRDRDQACAHYDGAFLFIARLALPEIRRLRPFDENIGDITWLTYNAKPVDALLMNTITKERWMSIATDVQASITDEVIAEGMSTWPRAAYDLHGRTIEIQLRKRRDQLLEAAEDYFEQVNEALDVLASEKDDLLELTYESDERVTLRIRRKKDGDGAKPFFERSFVPGQTEEVRIYALDGEDELVVRGEPHSRIDFRFVGGTDLDRVRAVNATDNDSVSASAVAIYDRPGGIEVDESIRVDDERSGDPYRNQYDFDDPHHEPVRFGGLPTFLFNADDGLLVQAGANFTLSGFKRTPYASTHSVSGAVATTTAGARASYRGHFPNTVGGLDQELLIAGTTPLYTRNFFGFTSAFVEPDAGDRDFYRLRQSQVSARYGLFGTTLRDTLVLGAHGLGEFVQVEDTEGRFVTQAAEVTPESLSSRVFVGGQAFAEMSTLDNPSYPKRGFFGQVAGIVRTDATTGTESRIGTSGLVSAALGTHIPFGRSQRVVLGTRLKYQQIVGDFPFYHAPTLGDVELRAFNDEQLAGNGVFAQSTDLRVELLRFDAGLPSAIGVAASVDHGFAFGSDVAEEDYQLILGGTAFWSILDLVGLQVSYYRGIDEGSRLVIGLGPLFAQTGFLE